MTLHTLAMVLKQSVVFSIGKFLFCKCRENKAGKITQSYYLKIIQNLEYKKLATL
jgi:hypothetical protein